MSLAACEIQNPPAAIWQAKAALVIQLAVFVIYIVLSANDAYKLAGPFILGYWALHFVTCILIGLAASRMGRRWWRYALWAVLMPFVGPMMSLHYLQRWRDNRQ